MAGTKVSKGSEKLSVEIPMLNIRMMTDEEWNSLVERSRLQREYREWLEEKH